MADAPAAAEAASSGGMPQLAFSTYPTQIFWLLVTLAVIYFILSRVALPRIGGVLAERAGTITNDLAKAEKHGFYLGLTWEWLHHAVLARGLHSDEIAA